jgi:hypothetical protein
MQNEIPFEEWHKAFKEKTKELGLPEFDESLAELTHMEALTIAEAIAQYQKELEQ